MAFVNLPSWLAALRSVSAVQLRAMYQAIAAVLNGGLDYRNFSPRARISTANKDTTRAWMVLEGQLLHPFVGDGGDGDPTTVSTGPSVLHFWIPERAAGRRPGTMKVANWGAWLGGVNGNTLTGAVSGMVRLKHIPKGGAPVEKDTFTLTNRNHGWLFSRNVAEFTVSPGDHLDVLIDGATYVNGATFIEAFGAAVWLKTEHVP